MNNTHNIRKITNDDYISFYKLINEFRTTHFSHCQFTQILEVMDNNNNHNNNNEMWVIEYNGELVATGTILYETKFIHNGGFCAHIEDICVQAACRKHGFGSILMQHLLTTAKSHGCYKIILDCSDELEPFYIKNGFRKNGIQMAWYA